MSPGILLVAVAALATGCASAASTTTARTLAAGRTQVSVAPEAGIAGMRTGGVKVPLVNLTAGVRHGVTDKVDVGARIWGLPSPALQVLGLAGAAKVQLRRAPDPDAGWDLSLDTALGYQMTATGGAEIHAVFIDVPLTFGFNVARGKQILAGPRVMDQIWFSAGSNPVNLPFAGASAGFAWRFGPRFALVPVGSLVYSPVTVNAEPGVTLFQLGIGLLFGGG